MLISKSISIAVQKGLAEVKKSSSTPEDVAANLENQFLRLIPRSIPRELGQDFFRHAWKKVLEKDLVFLPGDMADLLDCNYDDGADPLEEDDWAFIANTVPEFDQDLDLDTLQYLMKHIMDHGAR